jgi:acyl-CoA thioesterase
MHTSFDAATAVRRIETSVAGGTFAAEIHEEWQVGRGPNGGLVAALIVRALAATVPAPEWAPRSLTVHYLRPPQPGPCRILTWTERAGRSLISLSARLLQGEETYALALAAYALPRQSITLTDLTPPACPPLAECAPLAVGEGWPRFAVLYDYRQGIGDPPFSGSAHARIGGWLRLREPHLPDAPLVAAYTDAWMPCVFPRLRAPIAAPTVDLTIHFRATLPPPTATPDDYYLCVLSSRLGTEGFFEEDAEVWSADGVLLAQSRQLALLPQEAE